MKLVFILTILLSFQSFAFKKPKVTFISPDPKVSINDFWTMTYSNLEQAAKDLQVDLEIIYTDSHHSLYMKEVRDLAKRKKSNRPDYFIGLPLKHFEKEVLDILQNAGIKLFFVNMAIGKEARNKMGLPREKYKSWIGHFFPDDYNAGELITNEIAKKCIKNKNIVGISGNHLSTASDLRVKAFTEVSLKRGLNLQQVFPADWKKENVRRMIPNIESRYPNTCGFVVASDSMAEGIIENTKKKFQICGIDWTKNGLKLIKKGKLLCSAGGHFLEPAFALVTIFDYHNGIDFKDDIGLTFKTPFQLANKGNIDRILKSFQTDKQIKDFKVFSKFYSKKKKYNFSIKF